MYFFSPLICYKCVLALLVADVVAQVNQYLPISLSWIISWKILFDLFSKLELSTENSHVTFNLNFDNANPEATGLGHCDQKIP